MKLEEKDFQYYVLPDMTIYPQFDDFVPQKYHIDDLMAYALILTIFGS